MARVGLPRLAPPTDAALRRALASTAGARLTYDAVGCSLGRARSDDLVEHTWTAVVSGGSDRFERAVEALRSWQVHRGAGLRVVADGPTEVGREVALGVPLLVAQVVAVCRVVAVVDHDDAWGFAYGTLPLHPERGEESFVVSRVRHDVRFTIRAVTPPSWRRPFSALGARRYLRALQRAVDR